MTATSENSPEFYEKIRKACEKLLNRESQEALELIDELQREHPNAPENLFALGLAAVTFVLTLSFLVSFPGSWNSELGGFPALSAAPFQSRANTLQRSTWAECGCQFATTMMLCDKSAAAGQRSWPRPWPINAVQRGTEFRSRHGGAAGSGSHQGLVGHLTCRHVGGESHSAISNPARASDGGLKF